MSQIDPRSRRGVNKLAIENAAVPRSHPWLKIEFNEGALRFNVYGVRQRIEAAGSELLYVPPYSPDLNPIEKAWFKLKQLLRAAKARTKEALEEAITELPPQITQDNAKAWLRLRLGAPLPTIPHHDFRSEGEEHPE